MSKITGMIMLAILVNATAPAFAADSAPNCDSVPKSQWAQCVIKQSKAGSSE